MQIFLVCVGKLKEPFYRDACGEYEKRLSRYHKMSVLEVADERVRGEEDASSQKQALEREGRRILPHLQKGYPVALTLDGVLEDSLSFSARMEGYQRLGRPLVLVMGGSYGLHPEVLGHCRERVSLGMLTFPHNLARLILLEQLYRAAKIEGGEPYHK